MTHGIHAPAEQAVGRDDALAALLSAVRERRTEFAARQQIAGDIVTMMQRLQDAIVVPQRAMLSEGTWQSAGRILLGLEATPGFP